jgi:hypothetical protein
LDVTVTVAPADLPSEVTVIVDDPTPTAAIVAVDEVVAETVATPGALVDQPTVRSVSTTPFRSLRVTVSERVSPSGT